MKRRTSSKWDDNGGRKRRDFYQNRRVRRALIICDWLVRKEGCWPNVSVCTFWWYYTPTAFVLKCQTDRCSLYFACMHLLYPLPSSRIPVFPCFLKFHVHLQAKRRRVFFWSGESRKEGYLIFYRLQWFFLYLPLSFIRAFLLMKWFSWNWSSNVPRCLLDRAWGYIMMLQFILQVFFVWGEVFCIAQSVLVYHALFHLKSS